MTVNIKKSYAFGSVTAPPSKSISHRSLICASLTNVSKIDNIGYSQDINATVCCLETLGAKIKKDGDSLTVGGFNPFEIKDGTEIFCNESGSTLRFLIPLCLLSGSRVTLSGSKRLFERPLSVYEDICNQNGILFQKGTDSLTVCGKLKSGEYFVRGDISSQFISGLLFALPLLDGDSKINIIGTLESASYIDLTLKSLDDFGIKIKKENNSFIVFGNQKYKSKDVTVEGDCSNGAFLEAFNLFGGSVDVKGINENSIQGDRVYKSMFLKLKNGQKQFDLTDCPDLAPIMFAVSSLFGGAVFYGTKRLKIKESDRISAMVCELKKFGITVTESDNKVEVKGGKLLKPQEVLCGHNDHRIVMALSVLCSVSSGSISGAEAVNKSYPDFFEKISSLGIGIEYNET